MPRVKAKLLIVSHVLVSTFADKIYVKGSFGRRIDALAARFDVVYLLTCHQAISCSTGEYSIKASNLALIPIPNIWHPNRFMRYLLRLRGMSIAAVRLPDLLSICDIVHPRLPSPIGFIGVVMARLWRKSTFVYIAGDREELLMLNRGWIRLWAKYNHALLRLAVKNVLCFTAGPALAQKFGGESRLIHPILSGSLNSDKIADEEEAIRRTTGVCREILFVGGISEAKGVHILLRSLHQLRNRGIDLHLTIIGASTDGGVWLNEQLKTLNINDMVRYKGKLAWEDVLSYYDKSDVLVLSSLSEGVPQVIIEAMSRGLPTIATRVGSVPWIIQDRVSGLLVNPNSVSDLTDAILHLANEEEMRVRFVKSGLAVARRATLDATVDFMVERVVGEYDLEYH